MSLDTGFDSAIEMARLAKAFVELPELTRGDVCDGAALWGRHAMPAQDDDRRLYWQRLVNLSQLAPADRPAFEAASRGLTSFAFSSDVDLKIAITGFDPFHLDDHLAQGNPSGLIALQLHGRRLTVRDLVAEIQCIVVPVRYRDFDDHLIENFFAPRLANLDMVITVSMGRDGFDLERFPGRRRSVTTPDNENRKAGGTPEVPIVPDVPDGPEFVEFSLPVDVMCGVTGDFLVTDNRVITTLEDGEMTVGNIQQLENKTSVFGSGGGYLSNEISYRLLRLAQSMDLDLPVGHIHTPSMQGFDQALLKRVSSQTQALIFTAIKSLR